MIKLTVMYNLPPEADPEEYLKCALQITKRKICLCRVSSKSDFYAVKSSWKRDDLPYRYLTEAYYPDMETFEKSFFDPEYQVALAKSLERITDALFLISEEVISASNE